MSGSDAGLNALFGSLQVITANKLGLSPILVGAVTGQEGQEGAIPTAINS